MCPQVKTTLRLRPKNEVKARESGKSARLLLSPNRRSCKVEFGMFLSEHRAYDDIRYLVIGRGTQVSAGAPRGDGVTATQLWSELRAHTDDEFRSTL